MPPGASTILGIEFSGHVEQVGEGVSEWTQGDEVLGLAAGVSTRVYECVVRCWRDASVSFSAAHTSPNACPDHASIPPGRVCGICRCTTRQPNQETNPPVLG